MSEAPEAVARRLIEEGFNQGRLEVADELTSPALVEHQSFGPNHPPGAEGVKAVIASLRRAFSDFHLEIEDVAVAGENVWLRMTGSGTNDGPFMGNAPTGRTMRTPVFDVLRVRDGRMVEHWGVPDRLGALLQLGLSEPPSSMSAPGTSGSGRDRAGALTSAETGNAAG
jgi:predicted ester cyclase